MLHLVIKLKISPPKNSARAAELRVVQLNIVTICISVSRGFNWVTLRHSGCLIALGAGRVLGRISILGTAAQSITSIENVPHNSSHQTLKRTLGLAGSAGTAQRPPFAGTRRTAARLAALGTFRRPTRAAGRLRPFPSLFGSCR